MTPTAPFLAGADGVVGAWFRPIRIELIDVFGDDFIRIIRQLNCVFYLYNYVV